MCGDSNHHNFFFLIHNATYYMYIKKDTSCIKLGTFLRPLKTHDCVKIVCEGWNYFLLCDHKFNISEKSNFNDMLVLMTFSFKSMKSIHQGTLLVTS